ncbi:MAG: ABC transporter ATP-binding protein [Candidatus Sumerlaeaceae bacterium]|nr:ABC transporter ATP-binding protein [Candidatus Sumerlaeaceae bacterium]
MIAESEQLTIQLPPCVDPVISAEKLSKCYGGLVAVKDLSFWLCRGEILGLLGPNGAGKTTVLRLVLGFIAPSGGHIKVFGISPRSWKAVRLRKRIGFLPGDLAFDEKESGERLLRLYARLSGGNPASACVLCERLGLGSKQLRMSVRRYSRGMKQKLGIIAALQHEPDLIILDEPTNALDPTAQHELYAILRERAASGAAILFSTHVLPEALDLCHRIAVLAEGRLMDCFSVSDFIAEAPRLAFIRLRGLPGAEAARQPPPLPKAQFLREEDGWLVYEIATGASVSVLRAILDLPLIDVRIESAALDHLMSFYQGNRGES